MTIEGLFMPNLPAHPRVQRKMPSPFQRPSIAVGEPDVRREWRDIPAAELAVGDTVPGVGIIRTVTHQDRSPFTVTVNGGDGNHRAFAHTDRVFAFTRAA